MAELKQTLQDDMKQAMKSKEKERLSAIRFILNAIKQREIDERITLDDEQVLAILDKLAKQRRESISQFQEAKRDDLVAKEQFELTVIEQYLPAQLSEEEVDGLINKAITDTGASAMKDMGQVMAILKPELQGRADMGKVSQKVKAHLTNG